MVDSIMLAKEIVAKHGVRIAPPVLCGRWSSLGPMTLLTDASSGTSSCVVTTSTFATLVNSRPAKGMDSPSGRHPVGMPPGPLTLHPNSGRLDNMHIAGVLVQCSYRILVGRPPQWHTLVAICRRYDILHPWIPGGSADSLLHEGHLIGFLWSSTEPGQVHLCQVRVTRGGDGLLLGHGDTHWSPTDLVPGGAACPPPPSAPELASGVREDGDALRRLACTPLVTRGLHGSVEDSPGRYTHLLHVDLQDVSRRQETSREDHAELLLARFLAWWVTRGGVRCVDYCVPDCVSRRARHTSPLA